MPKPRHATKRQILDAFDVIQRVLETETFRLTRTERLAMMDTKKALKVLVEMREKN